MAEQNRKIIFSRERIAAEIKRLGQEITRDYGDPGDSNPISHRFCPLGKLWLRHQDLWNY